MDSQRREYVDRMAEESRRRFLGHTPTTAQEHLANTPELAELTAAVGEGRSTRFHNAALQFAAQDEGVVIVLDANNDEVVFYFDDEMRVMSLQQYNHMLSML